MWSGSQKHLQTPSGALEVLVEIDLELETAPVLVETPSLWLLSIADDTKTIIFISPQWPIWPDHQMMIIIICFQTQLPSWSVCHLIPLLIWKIEANIRKVNIGNLASLLTVHILWILAHCNGYWIKTYRSCLNLQRICRELAKVLQSIGGVVPASNPQCSKSHL